MYDAAGGSSRGYYLTTGTVVYSHEPENNRSYVGVWFDLHAGGTYFIGHNLTGGFAWYINGNYAGGWGPSGQYSVPQYGYTRLYWWEGYVGHDVNGGLSMSSDGNLRMVNQGLNYSLPYVSVAGSGSSQQNYYRGPNTPTLSSAYRSSNGDTVFGAYSGSVSNSGPTPTWYLQRADNANITTNVVESVGSQSYSNTLSISTTPNLAYYARVRGTNSDGTAYSSASGILYGVPSAPTGLTATRDTVQSNKINLSWIAPTNTQGGITGYRIYRDNTYLKSVTGTSTDDVLPLVNQSYTYRVVAYNAVGYNDSTLYSSSANASAITPGLPSAPIGPVLVSIVGLDITVTCPGASQNSYGNAITSYVVRYRYSNVDPEVGTPDWTNWSESVPMNSISDRTKLFSQMDPAVYYQFQVRAVNSITKNSNGDTLTENTSGTTYSTTNYSNWTTSNTFFLAAYGKRYDPTYTNPNDGTHNRLLQLGRRYYSAEPDPALKWKPISIAKRYSADTQSWEFFS